jgi:methionyl aminopeptidase
MTFTIEPMFNEGTSRIKILADGWRAVTVDGKRSAQWEHTVLVTEQGYEILTLRGEEEEEGERVQRVGSPGDIKQ